MTYKGGTAIDVEACERYGCWACLNPSTGNCRDEGAMGTPAGCSRTDAANIWCELEWRDVINQDGWEGAMGGNRDACSNDMSEIFEGSDAVWLEPGLYEISINELEFEGTFDISWTCDSCEVSCGGTNYFCEGGPAVDTTCITFSATGGAGGAFNPMDEGMRDFIGQVCPTELAQCNTQQDCKATLDAAANVEDPHSLFTSAEAPAAAASLWSCMENTMDVGGAEEEGSTATCSRPCEVRHSLATVFLSD